MPNPFAPARLPLASQLPVSRTEVNDHVEVFDEASDTDLQHLDAERIALTKPHGANLFEGGDFVVLDERSAEDKTVVVHSETYDWRDQDMEIAHKPELIGQHWETWRIPFSDCFNFIVVKFSETEFESELFRKERERFTNADGVFDVKGALAWYSAESADEQAGVSST